MTTTVPADETYLQRQSSSRRRPVVGDVFVMQLPDQQYLAGRVVISEPDRQFAPGPMCILAYVYAPIFATPEPDTAWLNPSDLLIAPVWVNRKLWGVGLFRTIANRELEPSDLVKQHCFEDPMPRHGIRYRDERNGALSHRSEPCGVWGMAGYRHVDRLVRDAVSARQ